MLVCIVLAQKPDGGGDDDSSNGTNSVGQVMGTNETDGAGLDGMGSLVMMGSFPPDLQDEIDAADIMRGYRLESVTVKEQVSCEMPEAISPVGTWHLTGAYDDVVPVEFDSFAFPLGCQLITSLWAHTWGTARPQLSNRSNELVAVGAPLSAIPGFSRFWSVPTTNDTLLLTWENFTLGRIAVSSNASSLIPPPSSLIPPPSSLVSSQLELFRCGDFVARSNNVESVYRRINPDDWDDDGIPNEDDLEPMLYDGNHFGPNQDMSFTSNLSAYCWVDIVVHQANARVTFVGDGASDLADPSFIAEAEETYRVNLLIGKTYQVKCTMPFEVVGKSDADICTWWGDGSLWINWYVDVWAMGEEDMCAAGSAMPRQHRFTMRVSPDWLGGSFAWTKYCCSISGIGYAFTSTCREGCGCGGCWTAGNFCYEGYALPATGGNCACYYEDVPDDSHDEPEIDPVGVSAGFSRKVIFFEDAYANTTNQTIPWNSQVLELVCSAYGGPNGGSVSISLSGDGRLIQYGGQVFPILMALQPYEVVCFTNTYRAVAASSSANDIVVTASFVENETDWTDSSNDRATAVKVEIKPLVYAPENESDNRHGFGIGEVVRCMFIPDEAPVSWVSNGQGVFTVFRSDARYRCPLRSESNGFKIVGLGSEYTPLDVSFSGVEMEEVPDADASRSGYFSDSYFMNEWYHGRDQHAGVWSVVTGDNQFLSDEAGFLTALPQLDAAGHVSPTGACGWTSGTLTWEVPCGWAAPGVADEDDPVGTFAAGQLQIMSIDGAGNCEVRKHSNVVRRTIDGHIYLNGVQMQLS